MKTNKNKLLSILFAIASVCFFAGTINHIVNTGEGIISSLLLALGCLCLSVAFYKKQMNGKIISLPALAIKI